MSLRSELDTMRRERDEAIAEGGIAEHLAATLDDLLAEARARADAAEAKLAQAVAAVRRMQKKASDGYQGHVAPYSEYSSGYESACSWFEDECDMALEVADKP